jgi:hypothetical protein
VADGADAHPASEEVAHLPVAGARVARRQQHVRHHRDGGEGGGLGPQRRPQLDDLGLGAGHQRGPGRVAERERFGQAPGDGHQPAQGPGDLQPHRVGARLQLHLRPGHRPLDQLGLRPHLLIEWKQMMREAGLVEIQVQDWTEAGAKAAAEADDEPELTWQQKVQIAGRAWRQLGWKAARGAVARERALLKELTRERVLGFQLLKGVKWPHARQES